MPTEPNQATPETPEPTPALTPAPSTPPAGGNPPKSEGNSGSTQEELDRQFAERARRAKETENKRLMELLGVKDEAELKAIVEEKRQADEARKTELEKLADQARKAEEKARQLEADATAKLAEMQKRVLDSEIKTLAAKAVTGKDGKVVRAAFRPEALDAVVTLIDRTGITDKDGKFEGLEAALDALAKANAYMLQEAAPAEAPKGTPRHNPPKLKSGGSQAPAEEANSLDFNLL